MFHLLAKKELLSIPFEGFLHLLPSYTLNSSFSSFNNNNINIDKTKKNIDIINLFNRLYNSDKSLLNSLNSELNELLLESRNEKNIHIADNKNNEIVELQVRIDELTKEIEKL
jgi:hypothetical protein